eukprot:3783028-Pyramimonas_sp.AAC.1
MDLEARACILPARESPLADLAKRPFLRWASNHSPVQARHPLEPPLHGRHLVKSWAAALASSKVAHFGSAV